MLKKILQFFGLLVLISQIFADPAPFSLKNEVVGKINLDCKTMPWGKELYVVCQGEASFFCEDMTIMVTVFYQQKYVQILTFTIQSQQKEKNKSIAFEKKWGPLNPEGQDVLPGEYALKIELNPQYQNSEFQKRWNQKYNSTAPLGMLLIFSIDAQELEKKSIALKKFYFARMHRLYELYKELETKKEEGLQLAKSKGRLQEGEFITQGSFDKKKWQKWLIAYLAELEKEKKFLEKHRKRIYFPLYPITLENLKNFLSILERMGHFISLQIHQQYGVEPNMALHTSDPFAIVDAPNLNRYLENLYGQSAAEMNTRLRDIFGDLPRFTLQ